MAKLWNTITLIHLQFPVLEVFRIDRNVKLCHEIVYPKSGVIDMSSIRSVYRQWRWQNPECVIATIFLKWWMPWSMVVYKLDNTINKLALKSDEHRWLGRHFHEVSKRQVKASCLMVLERKIYWIIPVMCKVALHDRGGTCSITVINIADAMTNTIIT